jgi:hypothetical protein
LLTTDLADLINVHRETSAASEQRIFDDGVFSARDVCTKLNETA